SKTINKEDLSGRGEHGQAPPCLQSMIAGGVPDGMRNEAMYAMTIYMRKRYSEDYRDHLLALNTEVFDPPLPDSEAKRTIKSASRRDYKYKCNEEPCKSLCNRELCLTLEYGIDADEIEGLTIESLQKITTEPATWLLKLENLPEMELTSVQLISFPRVKLAMVEKLSLLPKITIKQDIWERAIGKWIETAENIDVPDEASIPGIIRAELIEFLKEADLNSKGDDLEDREHIARGVPVVQMYNGSRVVFFKLLDFSTFLKRKKREEIKGQPLYLALRKVNVGHTRIKIGGSAQPVWYIPIDSKGEVKIPGPKFEVEF
ncbi:hypothetical protein LCGC14_2593830, partial [marine sediment metagenome]